VLGVTASADLGSAPLDTVAIVAAARARAEKLATQAGAVGDVDRILAVAADSFIVETPSGTGAVAGYPWFGEWSRDLFTSYEGLFLCTGRADEGRSVLTRAAGTVSEGMLANTADTGSLEYNTIDAILWFLHALGRHIAHTGDPRPRRAAGRHHRRDLESHRAGTRFGIGVDAATGLLRVEPKAGR
jgi:predicted glycogen debranching enzyme